MALSFPYVWGAGGTTFENCDYIYFNGKAQFALPVALNNNYTMTVDFKPDQYIQYMIITGNTEGNFFNHITMYNNEYYIGTGLGLEINFPGTFNERHVIEWNKNSKVYYDGVEKGNCAPHIDPYTYLTLGFRGDRKALNRYVGKFYRYKLTSIETGNDICDLVPKKITVTNNGQNIAIYGLFDMVNSVFYTACGVTGGDE